MTLRPLLLSAATTALALGLAACSDDATPATTDAGSTSDSGAATDAGGTSDSGAPTDAGAVVDAGPPNGPLLNGCSHYVDLTADGAARTVPWNFTLPQKAERCMIIKAGQTVTFEGDHSIHPLAAAGGDTPTPIKEATTITFAAAGTFGYVCGNHPQMTGVVLVK